MKGGSIFVRHRVYGKHLSRDKNQRTALFRSLVRSLITYGSITTTEPKAKAVKGLIDKIISKAKNRQNRRLVTLFLTQKEISDRLVKQIVPAVGDRTSGYTSILRLGPRKGDNAMMVKMSLVGRDQLSDKPAAKADRQKIEKISKDKKPRITNSKKGGSSK